MPESSTTQSRASGRPIALITGASEGFGRELSRLVAADGFDLIVVARNQVRLEELAKEIEAEFGVVVTVRRADLSGFEEQRALAEEVQEQAGLKLLFNNAAFSLVDDFHALPVEAVQKMISLNVAALATLCHGALNNADFCDGGTLVNVGSIGGSWPLPFDATYSATKAAIDTFSAAIGFEIERNPELDVHLQVVKLGGVNTDWSNRAMGALNQGETTSPLITMMMNDPVVAARSVWRQTKRRNKRVVFDWWLSRLQSTILGALPRVGSALVYANIKDERAKRGGA